MHSEDIKHVARWMASKENYQWLDFGTGKQRLEEPAIRMMSRREIHDFQVFTGDPEEAKPIGIVVLSDISSSFHTATLWYVLGEKDYGGQNFTSRAVALMLARAFEQLNLQTIFAWAVELNIPSVRVLEKNNFRLIGKRRKCHYIEGKPCDRLLFDLLNSEYRKRQS